MPDRTPAEQLADAVRVFHEQTERRGEVSAVVVLWEATRIDAEALDRGNVPLIPSEHYSVPLGTPALALGLARGFVAYAAGQVAAAFAGHDPDADE